MLRLTYPPREPAERDDHTYGSRYEQRRPMKPTQAGNGQEQDAADRTDSPDARLHAHDERADRQQGHHCEGTRIHIHHGLHVAVAEQIEGEQERTPVQRNPVNESETLGPGAELTPSCVDGDDAE